MTYKAFISYSHAQHAGQARKIYQLLSRYATPWYRRRRLQLFMDDANLPATPSIWNSIEQSLADSEYLVFLASPSAAASPWCAREIRYWLDHKSPDKIILILLAGEIRWKNSNYDFDWSVTDCLPDEFRGSFSDEPRYIDLSQQDFSSADLETTVRDKLADIASVLLELPKDELIGEDLRLHKRALRLARFAALVLFSTTLLALWQWHEATTQRDLARQRLSQAIDISEKMLFDIDEKLAGVAGAGELRRTLTYDALSLLTELRLKAAGDEDVEWAQMSAFYQQGNLALRLGDLSEAEAAYHESLKLAEKMVKQQPGYIEPYHSWALSYHALGKVKARQHQYPEAYEHFDQANQLAHFLLQDHPQDEDSQLLMLNIYQDWGDAAYTARNIPVAHNNYSAAIELIEKLVAKYPDDAEYWFLYALMLDRKALYFPVHSDPKSLLDTREQAVDVLRKLVDQFPEVSRYRLNLAVAYENWAILLLKSITCKVRITTFPRRSC